MVFALGALLAITTLAVDFARVVLTKSELSNAADAAARAGASALAGNETNPAIICQRAKAIAAANQANGRAVEIEDRDIEIGRWDREAATFRIGDQPSNAVRIRTACEAARKNGVPFAIPTFSKLTSIDVHSSAIAYLEEPPSSYNFAGIDFVKFSSDGVLASITGRVASNGNISIGTPLGLLVTVYGDARSYGGTVTKGSLASITGSQQPLPARLKYPSVRLPFYNDNERIKSYLNANGDFNALISANIPAGKYVVNDLNLLAGLAVNLEGPVIFYVQDDVNIAVGANLLGNSVYDCSNFRIRVLPGGRVNFVANLLTPVYMDIYAPDSPITIGVGVDHYNGRLVGKSLDIALPILSRFTEDQDPPPPDMGIVLVK